MAVITSLTDIDAAHLCTSPEAINDATQPHFPHSSSSMSSGDSMTGCGSSLATNGSDPSYSSISTSRSSGSASSDMQDRWEWVNISKPSEARSKKNLDLVRSFVQKPGVPKKSNGGVRRIKAPKKSPVKRRATKASDGGMTGLFALLKERSQEKLLGIGSPSTDESNGIVVNCSTSSWCSVNFGNTPSSPTRSSTRSCIDDGYYVVSDPSPVLSVCSSPCSLSEVYYGPDPPCSSPEPFDMTGCIRELACSLELVFPPLYYPVGNGEFEPFNALPKFDRIELSTRYIQWLKFNCIQFFGSESLRRYWTPHALSDRTFFLSTLLLPAEHHDMLRGKTGNRATKALKEEVARLVLDRLKDPNDAFSDYTAAALAHVGFASNYVDTDTQSILHYEALRHVIMSKGGCHKFDRVISKTVVIITLESAVLNNTEPHEVFVSGAAEVLKKSDRLWRSSRVRGPKPLESPVCCNPETGFSVLRRSEGCVDKLFELLQMMKRFGDSIIHSSTGGLPPTNIVQQEEMRHYVEALPSVNDLDVDLDIKGNHVYEACRIAAVIFQRACYMRVSLSSAVTNTNYIPELIAALKRTNLEARWGDMAGVLFWVTMIGASAAHKHFDERRWLVGEATRVTLLHAFDQGVWIISALHELVQLQRYWNAGRDGPSVILHGDEALNEHGFRRMIETPNAASPFQVKGAWEGTSGVFEASGEPRGANGSFGTEGAFPKGWHDMTAALQQQQQQYEMEALQQSYDEYTMEM